MKKTKPDFERRRVSALLSLALALLLPGVATAADEIVIGASLPLSGPFAGFGKYQQWGYQTAVDDANMRGGVTIGGKHYVFRLAVRDDKSDPNLTSSNTETLIVKDKALVMLGSCSPALVNAGAIVAERRKVPLLTGADPLGPFRSVRKWKYAWDVFFDEAELAEAPFRMLKDLNITSNKSVALVHDNGPDAVPVGRNLWPKFASQYGYTVKQHSEFPVDNMQFTTIVSELKTKKPAVVLVNAITPQTVALRNQMAAVGYRPAVLIMERGAEPEQFAKATGALADGVVVGAYWDPSLNAPGAEALSKRFEKETGMTTSQHIADSNAAANVLIDAIVAAQSLDRERINQAIARTDKDYVVGHVRFDATNTSKLPMLVAQWQGGRTVIVWPAQHANGKYISPK